MTKVRKKIGTIPINDIEQQVQQSTSAAITQMQQDVSDFIDEETAQYPEIGGTFKYIEDPEGRTEIKTDSEGKILSYRDSDGVLYENVGIETENLKVSESGLTDFQEALKKNGFQSGGHDFSEDEVIELPEPVHYGMLNLIVDALPTSSNAVSEGYAEYYDFAGNYFKIPCSIEPQGQTSKIFALTNGKGNYTLDLPKEIKFGSWVPQDSFHLKGCAKDITRGILATSYKLAWEVMNYLDAKPNRVLMDEISITATNATGDRLTDWPTDARCLPDGFPCEIYVNGEYWGLYSFQLKKHRKNYSMNKKDYKSFFIDADDMGMHTINNVALQGGFWTGDINWSAFEIKNPKDLYCMDGSKYDGDAPQELIDNTSEHYDSTNKAHKGSAQTKAIIQSFSTKYLEVKALIDNNDLVTAKTKFAEYFDVNACIFVYVFNCTMRNADSINKNTLWGTYNDGKIVPMLWDLDGMYGQEWVGAYAHEPSAALWEGGYATAAWPLALLWTLYETEIKAAYTNLRSEGVINIESWHKVMFNRWTERIGVEAYERDIEKWPETPSYRENYTNTEYWEEVGFDNPNFAYHPLWDENTEYHAGGTIIAVRSHPGYPNYCMMYRPIKDSIGVCPVTKFYSGFPQVGGFYDSPKRMQKWMEEQLNLCDALLNYNN